MSQSFKVLFFLKKGKRCNVKSLPIYVRVTADGERAEWSVQRNCDPLKWNRQMGRVLGTKEEIKNLNQYLDAIQGNIHQVQKEYALRNEPVTAEQVRSIILHKSEEKQHNLIEVYKYHNSQFEKLVGQEFSYGTFKKYKSALKSVEGFIRWKFNKKDVYLNQINYTLITDYEFYLKTIQKLEHNSAMGNIKKLKKIIRQCVANDWLDKDPFLSYKIKIRQTNAVCLSEIEVQEMASKQFITSRLNQVRDIFLFSCYTGLAYGEVKALNQSHINIGIDGGRWIFILRQKTRKTGKLSSIPLLQIPETLLEKYKDHPVCRNKRQLLPILSNQKMNDYLKEIGDICGINKELTFHTARHTFATMMLNNGASLESVSEMLGHSSIRQTQHYAKVREKMISEDMQRIRSKFESKPQIFKNQKTGS